MFSFFRKKTPAPVVTPDVPPGSQPSDDANRPAPPAALPPPAESEAALPPVAPSAAPVVPPPAAPDRVVPVQPDAPAPTPAGPTASEPAPTRQTVNPVASPEPPVSPASHPPVPPALGPSEAPPPATPVAEPAPAAAPVDPLPPEPAPAAEKTTRWWTPPWSKATAQPPASATPTQPPAAGTAIEPPSAPEAVAPPAPDVSTPATPPVAAPVLTEASPPVQAPESPQAPTPVVAAAAPPATVVPATAPVPAPPAEALTPQVDAAPPAAAVRTGWMDKLKAGLRKTGSSIATVFTGTRIDDDLYEELETALLMADTGVKATEFLLADLKRRVRETRTTDPAAVKGLLADAIADLLVPLQKVLVVGDRPDNLHNGQHGATVIMVAGVNGAGKTTSIGKLTKHLADHGASVLLAAADTFRAAAREQLAIWADRNTVEIISQQGGDPAAVSFDAVSAGRARGKDVVLVDTAGRLPTQLHLMEELKKIKRVVQKADATAPHEVLLVIDGNTGQNALAQVKAFDDALTLTGLVVTKLDGTAKGGVLCAIAREKPVPVYFIGVGEKLEDLETFNAREFAQALLA